MKPNKYTIRKSNKYTTSAQAIINEEVNKVLMEIASEIQKKSKELKKYPTDAAITTISAYIEITELLKSKMQ